MALVLAAVSPCVKDGEEPWSLIGDCEEIEWVVQDAKETYQQDAAAGVAAGEGWTLT